MTKASRWRVVAVVAIGLFMAILDTTIVSVTLPQVQKVVGLLLLIDGVGGFGLTVTVVAAEAGLLQPSSVTMTV